MSTEVWALVGVIVGAILGGFAQIAAGTLSDRRAHQGWVRDQRLGAYQNFLTRTDGLLWTLNNANFREEPEPHPNDEFFDGGLTPFSAPIEMFGDRKVIDAVDAVRSKAHAFAERHVGMDDLSAQIRDLETARDAYVRAIRKDLAVE
ncbi:hypothetical protein ATK17_1610 [Branchiibius hedensis]|uniref:Uncharacterized protein n=1 Tax=Branchiibius hedensis TaxID=672460 RepID=A0A2Y8ZSM5_9MICO|nr:hypothetical protein [Branchiibius hedensis]PWJ25485.1 hypothetical protein ATK17_1610 [Branchiibius hedensis]SSA34298.1 hypothetical protein SAMN04489750_1610 [Branchiibius hedensis]